MHFGALPFYSVCCLFVYQNSLLVTLSLKHSSSRLFSSADHAELFLTISRNICSSLDKTYEATLVSTENINIDNSYTCRCQKHERVILRNKIRNSKNVGLNVH